MVYPYYQRLKGARRVWRVFSPAWSRAWDRIVLSGYIERLQRPREPALLLSRRRRHRRRQVAVLEQRTNAYKAWVESVTEERGIPVVAAPRGVRKEELVEPYYQRLKGAEGVACVLTSMEQGRTFVSYVPRWKVPSGDANYRFIKACRKQFLHDYWYAIAAVASCRIGRGQTSARGPAPAARGCGGAARQVVAGKGVAGGGLLGRQLGELADDAPVTVGPGLCVRWDCRSGWIDGA